MTVALVTGGNRGIGYAVVKGLASRLQSLTIIIGCRDVEAGQEAIRELTSEGVTANLDVVKIDIEDDESILQAVAAVEEKYGHLDGEYIFTGNFPSFSFSFILFYFILLFLLLFLLFKCVLIGMTALVNNAAKVTYPASDSLSDIRAAANALYNNGITSHEIVTRGFLPLLRKSAAPRVVMMSSGRGSMGKTAARLVSPT